MKDFGWWWFVMMCAYVFIINYHTVKLASNQSYIYRHSEIWWHGFVTKFKTLKVGKWNYKRRNRVPSSCMVLIIYIQKLGND